ncbi:MAG: hypothetical protein AB1689_22705 [Thermodesulfobacteriota bacterium]
MSSLDLEEARRLFGDDLIEPATLSALLGSDPASVPLIPFARETAEAAQRSGCILVYRPATLPDGRPLTLATLAEVGSGRSDGLVAFAGEEPWFVGDPVAGVEPVEAGWALAAKEPWPETINKTYPLAEQALARRAGATPWRRRRAAEIAFDTLAFAAARRTRLLADRWDWSSTSSLDGGLLNVGGFKESGLEVLSYSRAVKHGALGICPTLVGHPGR